MKIIALMVGGLCCLNSAMAGAQPCASRPDLEARLKRAPGDDAAMECLAKALIAEGKPAEAADWMQKAVTMTPQSAQHQLWLGNALREQMEAASTLRRPFLMSGMKGAYEQAVALDPTLIEARHWLVMVYSMAPAMMGGSMDKAREHAQAIVALDQIRGETELAQLAERQSDYRGAVGIYERLIKTRPDAINAHLSIGRLSINNLKDSVRGEAEVRFWLTNLPKDASAVNIANAHYLLGVVLQQKHEDSLAKAEYQIALSTNPKHEGAKKALTSLK